MSIKIWICSLFLFSFSSSIPPKSSPWGFYGHKKINYLAVFTLPPEMIGFYKKHISYLEEQAVLPDKRRYIIPSEGPKHFIDLDHFDSVPKKWRDATEFLCEDTLREYGILPWNISWKVRELEKAFLEKDGRSILKFSAELGHYIGDAHVPLHTTENYNGQLSNQHGIHGLWESRLVELNFSNYDFFVGKANYIEDPLDYIWTVVYESHSNLYYVLNFEKIATDSIGIDHKFSFETRGNSIVKTYSTEYCEIYHNFLDGMVESRMKESVLSVGSIWFTAWVNGGQPDLNEILLDTKSLEIETKDSLKSYESIKLNPSRKHEH